MHTGWKTKQNKQNKRCKWRVCSSLNRKKQREMELQFSIHGACAELKSATAIDRIRTVDIFKQRPLVSFTHLNTGHVVLPLIAVFSVAQWLMCLLNYIYKIKWFCQIPFFFQEGRKGGLGLEGILSHSFCFISFETETQDMISITWKNNWANPLFAP